MPFALSDDEVLVQKTLQEFARTRVGLERAHDNDRHDRIDADALAEMAQLGLLSLAAPAESGGASSTAFALAVHEMAQVDASLAAILAVHGAATRAVAASAGPGRDAALAALAQGPCTLLYSEESHGSDVSTFGTRATQGTDGAWSLTGQKAWGLGAAAAKSHLVAAHTKDGSALFLVPADAAGLSLSQAEPLLGLRAAGIRTVYLSNVQLPERALVAAPGAAPAALVEGRAWLQVGAAAALAGCIAGAFAAAREFATNRIQFGNPIGTYQAVSDTVANIDIALHATRALALEAAAHIGQPDGPAWAARAKAFAADQAIAATRSCIRVQGGTGFMREGGSERFARDARVLQFVGETAQMQRDTVKRAAMPDIAFAATP